MFSPRGWSGEHDASEEVEGGRSVRARRDGMQDPDSRVHCGRRVCQPCGRGRRKPVSREGVGPPGAGSVTCPGVPVGHPPGKGTGQAPSKTSLALILRVRANSPKLEAVLIPLDGKHPESVSQETHPNQYHDIIVQTYI